MTARFGPFTLDVGTRRLTRGDEEIHLTPKAFDLPTLLVEKAPRVARKSELHERLWPGEPVVGTAPLRDGARIDVGSVSIVYRTSSSGMSTVTRVGGA